MKTNVSHLQRRTLAALFALLIAATMGLCGCSSANALNIEYGTWVSSETVNGQTTTWELTLSEDGTFNSAITSSNAELQTEDATGTLLSGGSTGTCIVNLPQATFCVCHQEGDTMVLYQNGVQTATFQKKQG